MNDTRFGELEVLCSAPSRGAGRPAPLLFVHGAYTGAWCWAEHFLPWFAARGHSCYALSLSGHGGTHRRAPLDTFGIDDYVADIAAVVARLPAPPVLIGHSMGGLVVQKYLERDKAPAAVLLASVPPHGLMGSAFGLVFRKPSLLRELNSLMNGGQPELDSLREALFHQPVDEAALLRYYRLSQPESHRAIWDMTWFNLPRPPFMHRPPMLVLGAEHDHLIPPDQVRMTAATYGTVAEIFPSMGHGLMLEQDWQQVATRIDAWLENHDL